MSDNILLNGIGKNRLDMKNRPLVMAHRGGMGLFPENTIPAFRHASDLGSDVLEMDIRSTLDGELVVIHDARVNRVTDGTGPVNRFSLSSLKKLDAGYSWSPDNGRTFPFRGKGIRIPTLREVFQLFPEMRMNIDIKQTSPPIYRKFGALVEEYRMENRVTAASFQAGTLLALRNAFPCIRTSASRLETALFFFGIRFLPGKIRPKGVSAFQIPEHFSGIRVLTDHFLKSSMNRGIDVHVWVVNEPDRMRRLIRVGVDGIVTDFPDRLITVLKEDGKNL